jgi:flavin reductase (DIM6/NTAB) family NADH-FMN oxidoreductase RutF
LNPYIAPVELPKSFRLINHGPTVLVSARHGGVDNVMAAAWCCALDFSPPKLTIILDKATKTRALIEQSGQFVIQVPTVAQAKMTVALGGMSLADEPDKLAKCGAKIFRMDGYDMPFVEGCTGWLACRVIPELHNQQAYDLFIGEIVAAWSDTRVFSNGRWHFETAPPELRSIHHVSGGHFYAAGDPVDGNV